MVRPETHRVGVEELQRRSRDRMYFWIYGAISYADIYGKEWRTEFSSTVRIILQQILNRQSLSYLKTAAHNGTDDDCERDPYASPGSPIGRSKSAS